MAAAPASQCLPSFRNNHCDYDRGDFLHGTIALAAALGMGFPVAAELVKISQMFNKNILESVLTLQVDPMDLTGLPADFVQAHQPGPDGKVALKTDNPDYQPVVSYAADASVREAFWKLNRLRAQPVNLAPLDQMLARRHELARLLGFAIWADFITADKMIGNGNAAAEFIDKIAAAAPRAQRDYAQLLARKRKDDPGAPDVLPWDTTFLNDRIKSEQ
ncbi:MAG: hypothetical protein NVS2B4_05250 [Ramlibacter sp.]